MQVLPNYMPIKVKDQFLVNTYGWKRTHERPGHKNVQVFPNILYKCFTDAEWLSGLEKTIKAFTLNLGNIFLKNIALHVYKEQISLNKGSLFYNYHKANKTKQNFISV